MARRVLGKTVDRGFAKAVAWKRTVTGSLSLFGAVAMIAVALGRGEKPLPMAILAAGVFGVVGAWALRDGLRILRELRSSA